MQTAKLNCIFKSTDFSTYATRAHAHARTVLACDFSPFRVGLACPRVCIHAVVLRERARFERVCACARVRIVRVRVSRRARVRE
eukprot:1435766-Pleurochrysis_carterae.AAC.1